MVLATRIFRKRASACEAQAGNSEAGQRVITVPDALEGGGGNARNSGPQQRNEVLSKLPETSKKLPSPGQPEWVRIAENIPLDTDGG